MQKKTNIEYDVSSELLRGARARVSRRTVGQRSALPLVEGFALGRNLLVMLLVESWV